METEWGLSSTRMGLLRHCSVIGCNFTCLKTTRPPLFGFGKLLSPSQSFLQLVPTSARQGGREQPKEILGSVGYMSSVVRHAHLVSRTWHPSSKHASMNTSWTLFGCVMAESEQPVLSSQLDKDAYELAGDLDQMLETKSFADLIYSFALRMCVCRCERRGASPKTEAVGAREAWRWQR